MFSSLEALLISLAHSIPLEAFVFIASFIEEVIAPIPSMAVLLTTGSLASIQDRTLLGLIPLALLAALGKTIGALIVYFFAEKIGNGFIARFGRFFEVTQADIENLGNKITGTKKDYVLLTLFRALPIVPSVLVSVGGGLLKLPLRLFIITAIIGSIVRDAIFLYIGYSGTELLNSFANKSDDIESIVQITFIILLSGTIACTYYKRHKNRIPQK
jgi:membrane protein DedA with SNARE-associated domain